MLRSLVCVLPWCFLFAATAAAAENGKRAENAAVAKSPVRAEGLVYDRGDGVERIPLLPPGPGNPRNSEGAFVTLADGRLTLDGSRPRSRAWWN
jgi:hypothetical protein